MTPKLNVTSTTYQRTEPDQRYLKLTEIFRAFAERHAPPPSTLGIPMSHQAPGFAREILMVFGHYDDTQERKAARDALDGLAQQAAALARQVRLEVFARDQHSLSLAYLLSRKEAGEPPWQGAQEARHLLEALGRFQERADHAAKVLSRGRGRKPRRPDLPRVTEKVCWAYEMVSGKRATSTPHSPAFYLLTEVLGALDVKPITTDQVTGLLKRSRGENAS